MILMGCSRDMGDFNHQELHRQKMRGSSITHGDLKKKNSGNIEDHENIIHISKKIITTNAVTTSPERWVASE
jgi:hypothetical protein